VFNATLRTLYNTSFTFINPKSMSEWQSVLNDDVNGWCKHETRGIIPSFVKNFPNTRPGFLAMNALSFKGTWAMQFDPKRTHVKQFTVQQFDAATGKSVPVKRQVTMMTTQQGAAIALPYVSNEYFEAIEMPFNKNLGDNNQWSFVLVIPRQNTTIEKLMYVNQRDKILDQILLPEQPQELQQQQPHQLFIGRKATFENITLPRFTLESTSSSLSASSSNSNIIELDETLRAMGMKSMYSSDSNNLLNMVQYEMENLRVKSVVQKVVIKVNEHGVEAASVTSIGDVKWTDNGKATDSESDSDKTSAYNAKQPRIIDFNRPFLFIVRHLQSGTAAFMGIVHEPKE